MLMIEFYQKFAIWIEMLVSHSTLLLDLDMILIIDVSFKDSPFLQNLNLNLLRSNKCFQLVENITITLKHWISNRIKDNNTYLCITFIHHPIKC